MQNNDVLKTLLNQSGDQNIKTEKTNVLYLKEYVTRDSKCYEETTSTSIINGETIIEKTLIYRRFGCQHPARGKINFGKEIFEQPRLRNAELQEFYKKHGYIIVCNECLRECSNCGAPTSTVTGGKIIDSQNNSIWVCQECEKAIARAEFWQKIKNFFSFSGSGVDLW